MKFSKLHNSVDTDLNRNAGVQLNGIKGDEAVVTGEGLGIYRMKLRDDIIGVFNVSRNEIDELAYNLAHKPINFLSGSVVD